MRYIKKLKKYFIPHKRNTYLPHFFRSRALLAVATLIVFFFVSALAVHSLMIRSGSSQIGAVIASLLVELTNSDRKENDLGGLTVNPLLEQAAQMKAEDMAKKGYFAHESPEGVAPWYWFEEAGYEFSFAGENLAVFFSDSAELQKAWMNSPGHRANILNSYFTEIGIGIAKGTYQGRETVFVVQEFGRPSRRVAVAKNEAVSASSSETMLTVATTTPTGPATTTPTTTKIAINDTPVVKGVTTPSATPSSPEKIVAVEETEMFIAVQTDEEGVQTLLVPNEQVVVTAGTSISHETPILLKVGASPRTSLKIAYMFLGGFILLALLLMIGIEIKRQHPVRVAYGVLLILFMGVLVYAWQGVLFGKLLIV